MSNTELIADLQSNIVGDPFPLMRKAADAIEALEKERDDLRSQVESLNVGFNNCQKERDALQAEVERLGVALQKMSSWYIDAQAQLAAALPVRVNAMLVKALEAAEKLEHEALVALSEATDELKVGNTYTTATDTYKAHNDLIHRLDKILNSQYRDRKRTALTAAKQAQPVCGYDDKTGNCTRVNCCKQAQPEQPSKYGSPELQALILDKLQQAQPERVPLSPAQVTVLLDSYYASDFGPDELIRKVEQLHGIKQGDQHE